MNIMEKRHDITTLDEMIDKYIGPKGSANRDDFDRGFQDFAIGMLIKESRLKLEMTQEQLARKVNKKREYISRVENNCGNITLKSLRDIVEIGLGGKLHIEVIL